MADLNITVPALEKLLDYTASGIGSVAGTMLAPWKARREAEARRITAQANADALEIEASGQAGALQTIASARMEARQKMGIPYSGDLTITDAIEQRILFQEEKKQRNIVSVVNQAALALDGKAVPDEEPDHDWTARFFNNVQDVSSEDMQVLWSKILAGQIEHPGTFSKRTLTLLTDLEQGDAVLFTQLCGFVWDMGRLVPVVFDYQAEIYKSRRVNYGTLLHLDNIGLVAFDTFGTIAYNVNQQNKEVSYYNRPLKLYMPTDSDNKINIGHVIFTSIGAELAPICNGKPVEGFWEYVKEKWDGYHPSGD